MAHENETPGDLEARFELLIRSAGEQLTEASSLTTFLANVKQTASVRTHLTVVLFRLGAIKDVLARWVAARGPGDA